MRKRVNLLLSFVLYLFLICLTVFLFIYYIRYSWVLLLIVAIVTILTVIIIFLTNRLIDVKLSWIIVVVCLPVLGIFLYWVFGRPYRYRKKQKVHLNLFKYFYKQEDWNFTREVLNNENPKYSAEDLAIFNYTTRISFRPIYTNTDVRILVNGPENYYQIIADLKEAKKYIFMNYYIIGDGELLETILKVLEKKVKEGVKVYIIYDHVGSYFQLSHETIRRIKKMGINFQRFAPIKLPILTGSYNFRNHRKDVIIDGHIGYAGGINLSDTYIHLSGRGFWRDTQVRLVGDAVKSLELIFRQDWHFITGVILDVSFNTSSVKIKNDIIVQLVDDGPLTKEAVQKDLFIRYISMAKKRVWITTPYLFPTGDLITALRNSAYSGVDVRLCLPGIVEHYLLLDMGRTYYDALLEAGVKIYEYAHVVNHSKMGIFDDKFTIIGSTNLDYRSLYSDHQTLVSIYDEKTNEVLASKFSEDFKYSNLIKSNPLLQRNKFYHYVFLFLMRVLAPLF
ncbi:cardiolipin synthase [Spiroplasma platyhelix]|uniref:Cardiolipin synthase n=1 Tax=Spiroplasma platyhelix PALS-1 TaxID=1276218 RepID=A0A846UDY2_9MOLU|nr:cardiolipin synthase [Spiroplasma platyhelix]MBE4704326.1 putative cardiolipin synthase YwiE [Spiroplasma platyhelix PALS-1]NKE38698.1 cardiolipin synthase [Spiroplasma platyhelix PALS-1]UJB28908.1 cardiolipin synthase [Spiroplasma platyhelix PALS-1]